MKCTKVKKGVFISSRQGELHEVRRRLMLLLLESKRNIPLAAEKFFTWNANIKDGMKYCLDQVASADYFIGIYHKEYGKPSPGRDFSPIHLEYIYTMRCIPLNKRLFFFSKEIHKRCTQLQRLIAEIKFHNPGRVFHTVDPIEIQKVFNTIIKKN